MAFTSEQEIALLALLDEPLVTLNELPKANQIYNEDLFLTRQDTVERAVTGEVMKNYFAPEASEVEKGIVMLSSSTDSEITTKAATPKSVKQAMDYIKEHLHLSGGTLSGGIRLPYVHVKRDRDWPCIKFFNEQDRNDSGLEVNDEGEIYLYVKNEEGKGDTTGFIKLKPNGYLETPGDTNILPVGIPQPWPSETPPPGWLKCNGSPFDKEIYPALAKAYPSGFLPDLRGEFIRGWDDGKGIDAKRNILSWQEDTLQNISGNIHMISGGHSANGVFHTAGNAFLNEINSIVTGNMNQIIFFDASRVARTSHETRPRNVAFLYIVRAA